jgi:hypothetical protein
MLRHLDMRAARVCMVISCRSAARAVVSWLRCLAFPASQGHAPTRALEHLLSKGCRLAAEQLEQRCVSWSCEAAISNSATYPQAHASVGGSVDELRTLARRLPLQLARTLIRILCVRGCHAIIPAGMRSLRELFSCPYRCC